MHCASLPISPLFSFFARTFLSLRHPSPGASLFFYLFPLFFSSFTFLYIFSSSSSLPFARTQSLFFPCARLFFEISRMSVTGRFLSVRLESTVREREKEKEKRQLKRAAFIGVRKEFSACLLCTKQNVEKKGDSSGSRQLIGYYDRDFQFFPTISSESLGRHPFGSHIFCTDFSNNSFLLCLCLRPGATSSHE